VQNAFTLTKIAALLGLILLGLFVGANATAVQANFRDAWTATLTQVPSPGTKEWVTTAHTWPTLLLALGTAMVGSLFSSDAWNNVTFTAGEVRDPKRTLPLSLLLGVGLVSLLYLLANLAYLVILPLAGSPAGSTVVQRGIQFAANERVATAAAAVVFGPNAAGLMAVLIMISTFGCINGILLAGPRAYYAMAQDGLFFAGVGTLNRRNVPGKGLALQCLWACLLTVSGTYGDLLDYVIFAVLLFYVLTMVGLFVLRRKRPEAERPYRAFGYPVVPAVYVGLASLIAVDLLVSAKTRPNAWPGLLIVLAGVPVYWLWKGRSPAGVSA